MTLEKEFKKFADLYKAKAVFEKILQYYRDLNEVDIPEFCKLPEDKLTYRADIETVRIIKDGKLDELYNKILT